MSPTYRLLLMHHLVMGIVGDFECVSKLVSVRQVKGSIPLV
jgi:hypothetical protein